MQLQTLGREDPLEKGKATHSNILAWKIPRTDEPGRLQTTGLQRGRQKMRWLDSVTKFNGYELGPTLGDAEGQESPECCSPWGCRVGHDLATEQQSKSKRILDV